MNLNSSPAVRKPKNPRCHFTLLESLRYTRICWIIKNPKNHEFWDIFASLKGGYWWLLMAGFTHLIQDQDLWFQDHRPCYAEALPKISNETWMELIWSQPSQLQLSTLSTWLLPSRHMGSLITSDFSCKSTLRVEEWKMKIEDNNCVSSFKVRQFMGVSTGLANAGVSPSSTISGVVRLAHNAFRVWKFHQEQNECKSAQAQCVPVKAAPAFVLLLTNSHFSAFSAKHQENTHTHTQLD